MLATPAQTSLGVLEMAQAGRFAEICEMFAEPLRPMVTPEALRAAWRPAIDRLGPVTSVGVPVTELTPGAVIVKVPMTCEHGAPPSSPR